MFSEGEAETEGTADDEAGAEDADATPGPGVTAGPDETAGPGETDGPGDVAGLDATAAPDEATWTGEATAGIEEASPLLRSALAAALESPCANALAAEASAWTPAARACTSCEVSLMLFITAEKISTRNGSHCFPAPSLRSLRAASCG